MYLDTHLGARRGPIGRPRFCGVAPARAAADLGPRRLRRPPPNPPPNPFEMADMMAYTTPRQPDTFASSLMAAFPNSNDPSDICVFFRLPPEYTVVPFDSAVAKYTVPPNAPEICRMYDETVHMNMEQLIKLSGFTPCANKMSTVMHVCGVESKLIITTTVDFSNSHMIADYVNALNSATNESMPTDNEIYEGVTQLQLVAFTVESDGNLYMHNTCDEAIAVLNAYGSLVKYLDIGQMSPITLDSFLEAPESEYGCSLAKRRRQLMSAETPAPAPAPALSCIFLVPHRLHLFTAVAHLYRKKDAGKYELSEDVYLQPGFYSSLEDVAAAIRAGIQMKGERNGGIFDIGVSVKRPVLRVMAHHRQPNPSYMVLLPHAGAALVGLLQTRTMPLGNKKFIDFDRPPKRVCEL